MNAEHLLPLLALKNTPLVSSKTALLLLQYFGNAQKIFEASKGDLLLALYPILSARCKEIINNLHEKNNSLLRKPSSNMNTPKK